MWSFIGGLVGGVVGKLFGFLTDWMIRRDEEKKGELEQAQADQQAAQAEVKEAQDVKAGVDAASDSELDQLRQQWTRPGSD